MDDEYNEFQALTNNILVRVKPVFYPDISNLYITPMRYVYHWIYNIKIENLGERPVQLLKRHWKIYDTYGTMEEVSGDGVVGQQPIINPMEAFEYSSQVRLFSDSGMMLGEYAMLDKISMETFYAVVPTFSLDAKTNSTRFKN